MKLKLSLSIIGAVMILGGCSTTADYSETVLRLEKAINDSAKSIETIDSDITVRQNNKLKKGVIAKDLLLDVADNECATGKEKCSLIVLKNEGGNTVQVSTYPLKSSMPKGIQALEQIKLYVSRLKSIVDADTAAKVTESANATLGSLEEITNQLAKEDAQDSSKDNKITEYKEPVMGLIEWITDRYVERVKKEALAKATLAAHPVIQDLITFYATAAQGLKLIKFSGFHNDFITKQKQFDKNLATSDSIDAYVIAATNYEVALKAQAANPLKSFNSVHEKLKKQLNGEDDKKTTLADVSAAIERMEQEATKIKELVDSFNKPNDINNGD